MLICTDGDKGTTDPDVEPAVLAEPTGGRGERGGARCSGWPASTSSDTPTASSSTTRPSARPWWPGSASCARLTVLGPDPTAVFFGEDYFNHRDHRTVGFALLDALSPAAALPHYFPEAGAGAPGADGAAVGHARAQRLGGHHATRSRTRWRRCRATAASSPTGATGPPRRCGCGPRRRAAGPAWPTPRASGGCGSVADAPRARCRRRGRSAEAPTCSRCLHGAPCRHGRLLRLGRGPRRPVSCSGGR